MLMLQVHELLSLFRLRLGTCLQCQLHDGGEGEELIGATQVRRLVYGPDS